MHNLTLYVDSGFSSPYAMAVFVALKEKGLPFEMRAIDLQRGEHETPAFLAHSLTGRIPVLRHQSTALCESSAIIEYLEEAFPSPAFHAVLPQSVHARALARQVQAWLRSDLMALRAERSTDVIFRRPSALPLSQDGQAAADRLISCAERVLVGDFLIGPWSIAHTELALMLQRLIKNGDAVPSRLVEFAQNQWQRPSVQAWLNLPRLTE